MKKNGVEEPCPLTDKVKKMSSNESPSNMINWLLNISYAVAFAAFSMILSLIFTQLEGIQHKVNLVPEKYVSKVDYRADRVEIVTALHNIDFTIKEQGKDIYEDYNRRMDKMEALLLSIQEARMKEDR
jgi:hypothetical protein